MPLLINETEVKKISGPVSMYILTPIKNELFPNLPIYMLFGDKHNSDKGLCEKSSESMNISSVEFLGLMNTLVNSNEYIDFYVEGGDLHNRMPFPELNYTDDFPMHNLWNFYVECYKKQKLATYKYDHTKCEKTSQIRWHSGDIRFFKDEKFKDLLIRCNMHNFLFLFESKDTLTKETFLDNLKSFNGYSTEKNSCFDKLLATTISFDDVRKEIFLEEGLINKQLKKINKTQREEIIRYINEYINYTEDKHKNEITPEINKIANTLIEIITKLKNFVEYSNLESDIQYLKDNWETLERYGDLMLYKYSITPDIYSICRSLKYLDSLEEDVPIINILYYGSIHTENVVHFLTKIIGKYNIRYFNSVASQNDNRCIEIKDNINLTKIVDNVRKGNYDLCVENPYFLNKTLSTGFNIHIKTLKYDIFGIDEKSVQSTRQMPWFPKKAEDIFSTDQKNGENKIEIIVKLLSSSEEVKECNAEIETVINVINKSKYDKIIIFIFYNSDVSDISVPNTTNPSVLILPIQIWSEPNDFVGDPKITKSLVQFLRKPSQKISEEDTLGGKSHHRKKSKTRSKSRSKSRGKSRKRSKSRGKPKRK